MPDHKFIGVLGGYAKRKQLEGNFPNVTYLDNTPDIKSIYAKTRVLLMPSAAESYGMVAIEGAASGIPTIAAPTPGLRESLQDAGTFVERADIDGWVNAIKELDDPEKYKEASKKALARFKEIEAGREAEMIASEKFLQDIIDRKL